MRLVFISLVLVVFTACDRPKEAPKFTSVSVTDVYVDSFSVRAITFLDKNTLAFAGNKGLYGSVDINLGKVMTNTMRYDTITPEFRAVANTKSDFFMLSVGSPALLYKTGNNGQMQLVYKEEGDGVFYDALSFFDDKDGIAIGDSGHGCLAILLTRDGGETWSKVSCESLPRAEEGEGAFAASNTNIETIGDKVWVATSAGRIYFSADRGDHWQVINTPMGSDVETQGIYSIDFYNENAGFAIGGDYTQPQDNEKNKIRTDDGGATWTAMAEGRDPGYKSCLQFVPNTYGEGLVAVGFTGISYSSDGGNRWAELSKEGFYTLHFINDSVAYAAGKNRISRLTFK